MDIVLLLNAIIIGLIEGATEFLPVSSTGHLILAGAWLGFEGEKAKVFEVVIQLGAILAICWQYRRKIGHTVSHLHTSDSRHLLIILSLAFLPAAILGLAFHHQIKAWLFSPVTVAIALVVGGLAILWIERRPYPVTAQIMEDITWQQALKVGLAQSLALIPGVSRAAATILGGMAVGLSRLAATEFSFFLAIPVMFAATGLDLLSNGHLLNAKDFSWFVVGFVTAFLSALLVVNLFLRFVSHHNFRVFAWYRIVLGGVILLTLGHIA